MEPWLLKDDTPNTAHRTHTIFMKLIKIDCHLCTLLPFLRPNSPILDKSPFWTYLQFVRACIQLLFLCFTLSLIEPKLEGNYQTNVPNNNLIWCYWDAQLQVLYRLLRFSSLPQYKEWRLQQALHALPQTSVTPLCSPPPPPPPTIPWVELIGSHCRGSGYVFSGCSSASCLHLCMVSIYWLGNRLGRQIGFVGRRHCLNSMAPNFSQLLVARASYALVGRGWE